MEAARGRGRPLSRREAVPRGLALESWDQDAAGGWGLEFLILPPSPPPPAAWLGAQIGLQSTRTLLSCSLPLALFYLCPLRSPHFPAARTLAGVLGRRGAEGFLLFPSQCL